MPLGANWADAVAFAALLAAWLGYGPIFGSGYRGRTGINGYMRVIRRSWAAAIVHRETRFIDASLLGHAIHSVAFFASTSMLVLAALVGLLGNLDWAYQVVADLDLAGAPSRPLFAAKAVLLVTVFAYGFFKFTWAIRQFNYALALVGGAPLPQAAAVARDGMIDNIAAVLTLASESVNAGIRSYYVALAVLAWLIDPWACVASTAWVLCVLLWRQFRSAAAMALRRQAEAIEATSLRERETSAQYAEAGRPSEKPPSATNSAPVQ